MSSILKISDLTFIYQNSKKASLQQINMDIHEGEFIGITGPTGAGKSTLALCMNGVIPHFYQGDFYGSVMVDQKDTVDNDCVALAGSIGSVFQDPEAQIVATVVEDEVAFGLENLNLPRYEMEERITTALEMTGISQLRNYSTARLSGGQKQRVAIAAAIALRPKILVLDEPTSELDPQGTLAIYETLKNLNELYGITVIIIEQKIQYLAEYCSRLVVLDKGKIAIEGPCREVLSRQDTLQGLGVNCPPVTQLAYMLKQKGLYHGEFPINVDEAYLVVSKVLQDKGRFQ
ncbi:ATP-binding cassette domain-containing protein [Petroclostridium sp. X23]|uniref:energy-coupling factor ABC transporter ATP-binding protein n=1 Tax=Petroclostridium sp. X23 TaxID=3045146 RepID=UPI0024AD37F9|nr:ATP-binding cassette domain-containing protein [Petroclostridium sp. X23]WHH60329.1 ATP-binding cassette domain-containing protein [Petroclostridium sp. X23]